MQKPAPSESVAAAVPRPGRRRINIPCTLRPEQAEALRKLSLREDLPCSVLLRQLVDRKLKEEGLL